MAEPLEIRCFCSRQPLLALAGRDNKTHRLYVHIKASKGGRPLVEAIVTSGTVRLRCRECLRWHKINILDYTLENKAEPLPESISI